MENQTIEFIDQKAPLRIRPEGVDAVFVPTGDHENVIPGCVIVVNGCPISTTLDSREVCEKIFGVNPPG